MSNKLLEATLDRVLNFNDGFGDLYDILSLFVGLLYRISRTPEGRTSRQCKDTCSGGGVSLCLTRHAVYLIDG